jgi:phage gpG-like protein
VFEVKTDFSVLERFRSKIPTLAPKLVAEVSKQTLYFVSDIQKNQMSGRRGGIYLNVDTGHLRRSWFSRTTMTAEGITTTAFTNVPYARIHQEGGVIHRRARTQTLSFRGGRFVSPSAKAFGSKAQGQSQMRVNTRPGEIRIPKRLFITEEFDRQMPERYERAVLKVIVQELKNG